MALLTGAKKAANGRKCGRCRNRRRKRCDAAPRDLSLIRWLSDYDHDHDNDSE
jgi:hypothetical protein